MLEQKAFNRLDATGFTFAELSALYFSRTLVECLAATPFQVDVTERVRQTRRGADAGHAAIPRSPAARHPGEGGTGLTGGGLAHQEIGQLLDATLQHRRAIMRYHSFSSDREKEYTIEPSRVVFAQGALYLVAYVPEYSALRTFAVDRIKSLSLTEERFEPAGDEEEAFAHSLGVHQGVPERIEIAFEPRIAPYVRERLWHSSQELRDEGDGGIVVTLNVSNDFALRSWILGFGALARVIAPAGLAAEIQAEAARWRRCIASSGSG